MKNQYLDRVLSYLSVSRATKLDVLTLGFTGLNSIRCLKSYNLYLTQG